MGVDRADSPDNVPGNRDVIESDIQCDGNASDIDAGDEADEALLAHTAFGRQSVVTEWSVTVGVARLVHIKSCVLGM